MSRGLREGGEAPSSGNVGTPPGLQQGSKELKEQASFYFDACF